jgi:hypothetical protein
MRADVKLDCRHYLGDRPCVWRRVCQACDKYAPMGVRVLVIKLAALREALGNA